MGISNKSIIISLVISLIIGLTGCSLNNTNNVYCDNCGEASDKVTKYCPNCGEEAKWLSEKTSTNNNSSEDITVNYKKIYMEKLNNLEASIDNPDNVSDCLTTHEMVEAEWERYQKWDDMLNEIYNLLKTQLSESEMKSLKASQIAWINYRDQCAENEASEYEGGTMQPIIYNGALATITKERCYELVNTYMK